MKIVALGGCGQEGQTAVRALLGDTKISSLVIGDLNEERAQAFAAELNDPRVSVRRLDVLDRSRLLETIAGTDVVVNFVGPYYRFGKSTLAAAIEARVDYVDINDDTDSTAECFKLHCDALNAGITAVIGLGASPGLSNVLARFVAEQFDAVERLDIRWQVSIADVDQSSGISAALLHFLHAVDGDIPQFIDGRMEKVPAYSGEETVHFASIGPRQAFFTAHPEPWTLSMSLPNVPTITCKGGVSGLDEVVPLLRALGLTSEEPLDLGDVIVNPRRVALALLDRSPPPDPMPEPGSGLLVTGRGLIDGRKVDVRAEVMAPASMSLLTGLPTAVGVQMLASGEVAARGALPPELAFEPKPFLARLAKLGVRIEHSRQG